MSRAGARSTALCTKLVFCALAIQLTVSANLLTWLGVPYVTEGGAFPFKIHPGNYIIFSAFCLDFVESGRSTGIVGLLFGKGICLPIYLGGIVLCLFYALLTTGQGNVIVLLDTFLPAGLVGALLQNASREQFCMVRRILQWGIAINAALALGEASQHASVVPLYLNAAEYHAPLGEYRPTALYDHPLTGGVMTMMGLALAPARFWLRSAYTCLLMAAMLAFGGRVAVATAILSWFSIVFIELLTDVARRDAGGCTRLISIGLICMGFLLLASTVIFTGLGTRLAEHFYWDPSAQVRVAQWNLLSELTIPQILFGTGRDDTLALLNPLWLNYGVEVIENFWLLMFVSLGVVGFSVFLPSLLCLFGWCWMRTGLRGRVLLFAVVIVASTSNSLGRKSTLLVSLIASTLCCCQREGRDSIPLRLGADLRFPTKSLVNV